MDFTTFVKRYVSEFKLCERELLDTNCYVTIDRKNFSTFSVKYRQLYLSICSSIDSLAEELCVMLDCDNLVEKPEKHTNITSRYSKIEKEFCNSIKNHTVKITLDGDDILITPFTKFSDKSTGDWWADHNKVKHYSTAEAEGTNGNMLNYELANLKNVLHALSAYYVLISQVYVYFNEKNKTDCKLDSQLFSHLHF